MKFICPNCLRSTLEITNSIQMPADSRSDDIIIQIISCGLCDFRGGAVYEESRRGGFDTESWDHTGFRLSRKQVAHLEAAKKKCPDRKNKRCECRAHRQLNQVNVYGRWQMPEGFDRDVSFLMRR